MGKLVSNVATHFIVLSTRTFYLIKDSFCNDLFSRFEQQILFLEKQAEATDPTTDRHGHDGPSQGLVSKHLENLKLGTENQLSELRNEMAGRTVTGVTDRHRCDGPSQTLQRN